MGDYVDRNQVGQIYVEIAHANPSGCQIILGHSEAGRLFTTQAADDQGVYQEILPTSEISISIGGAARVADFVTALQWLSEELARHTTLGPRPPSH